MQPICHAHAWRPKEPTHNMLGMGHVTRDRQQLKGYPWKPRPLGPATARKQETPPPELARPCRLVPHRTMRLPFAVPCPHRPSCRPHSRRKLWGRAPARVSIKDASGCRGSTSAGQWVGLLSRKRAHGPGVGVVNRLRLPAKGLESTPIRPRLTGHSFAGLTL